MKYILMRTLMAVALISLCSAASAQQNIPVPTPSPIVTPPQNQQAMPAPAAPTPYIYSTACPALMDGRIKANYVAALSDGECGERSPLKLTRIVTRATGGQQIALSGAPVVNCAMATRLADWIEQIDGLSKTHLGTSLAKITTGPGFQCRRRNGEMDGKISEHGFANALDVLGFELADGRKIDVLSNWSHNQPLSTAPDAVQQEKPGPESFFLEAAHKRACELFTTVLGPQTNADHKDHFHLDLGCHGKNCTYLLCE